MTLSKELKRLIARFEKVNLAIDKISTLSYKIGMEYEFYDKIEREHCSKWSDNPDIFQPLVDSLYKECDTLLKSIIQEIFDLIEEWLNVPYGNQEAYDIAMEEISKTDVIWSKITIPVTGVNNYEITYDIPQGFISDFNLAMLISGFNHFEINGK